jgi:acetyl esterase/lipase
LAIPRHALILFALLVVSACSPLGVYNSLVPKDSGVTVAASGVAYGAGPRQRLDVYRPEGASRGVVVFIYGGSWNSGSRGEYSFVGKAFAAQGYTTVIPDYRLVPQVRYPVFVQDAAKAVAWAYRNAGAFGADPQRLFVSGHSAGAYSAMMVALAPEFLRAEGLSANVIRGVAGLSGPYDFLPLDARATKEAFGGASDLASTQPVNRAASGMGTNAIFLGHGEADTLVDPRNSRKLAERLRGAGKTVDVRFYAKVDHPGTLLAIARNRRDETPVLADMIAFFDRQ